MGKLTVKKLIKLTRSKLIFLNTPLLIPGLILVDHELCFCGVQGAINKHLLYLFNIFIFVGKKRF